MSKQISRKEFIFKTLTGVAALGFIPEQIRDVNNEGAVTGNWATPEF